jgi:hypothetical protein
MEPTLSLPVLFTVLAVLMLLIALLARSVKREETTRRKPLAHMPTATERQEDLRIIDMPLGRPLANNDDSLLDDLGVRDLRD